MGETRKRHPRGTQARAHARMCVWSCVRACRCACACKAVLVLVHYMTRDELGPVRDYRDRPWKQPDHVTKDAQIDALTAEVSELHEQSTKVHDALRTVMATHTQR